MYKRILITIITICLLFSVVGCSASDRHENMWMGDIDAGAVTLESFQSDNVSFQTDTTGSEIIGGAVTATLLVHPDGDGTDGLSWATAYSTIQDALDAASTDTDDCTLILVSPHTTYYDINRTGDPTWAANVIIAGTHRNWAKVKNDHATATSIMKLTGKASVININYNLGTSGNGLIMTHGGFRVNKSQFVGEDLTSAGIALLLEGDALAKHGKVTDLDFLGTTANMTAMKLDQITYSEFEKMRIHECKVGIQVVGATSDENDFCDIDIGDSVLALDLDAGNQQHFTEILLHDNTTNVDDEVGDHHWNDIRGHFNIKVEPTTLTGVQVNTHANPIEWGGETTILAGVTATKPFRVVAVILEPSANEWYSLRFTADDGVTYYDTLLFDATKREGMAAPSGTEYIFNKGTTIKASAKSESGNNNVVVWIEIQEI